MTTDPTISLLRALSRGGTIADLCERTGLPERTVRRRLAALEDDGIEIERPGHRGRGHGPGEYRLRDPRQVLDCQELAPRRVR